MTKSVRFANTITALFSRGGGESVSYLLAAVLALGAASARADVVDLGGETVTISTADGFSVYQGKIIQNGTINLTTNNQSGWTDGTYTIGSGAVVNCAKEFGLDVGNRVYTLNIKDGGAFTNTAEAAFMIPLRYATATLLIDNGTLASTQYYDNNNRGPICIGYSWNNNSGAKDKVIDVKAILTNNSRLQVDTGKLQIGGAMAKNTSSKAKSVNIVFAVTNSTVDVKQGNIQIGANFNPGDWISNTSGSKTEIILGQGADVTCNQIYVYKSQTASILFDGATLRWAGSGNSFVGQNSSVSGDIYTIGEGGLTIDIPSGKSLGIDGNSSALKGTGGITKIGDGSITWNSITSSGSKKHLFTGPLVVSNGTWTSSLSYAASAFKVDGSSSTLALSGTLSSSDVAFEATDGGTLTLLSAAIADASPDMTLAGGGKTDYFTRDGAVDAYTLGTLTLGEDAVLDLDGDSTGVDTISATALALSATTDKKVTISFSDAANVVGGTYNLITITGGGTFADGDLSKFALNANLPEGSALSLSGDLTQLVLTVPASNPATWTGGANDNNLLSPQNWLGKEVPGADADVIISVGSATTLICNDAFSVKSITFQSTSAQVTISGSGCITNATEIVNASEARPVINVPVEFVADGAYKTIDVTGEVEFSGGVKGSLPANHTTFYGNYTLTATSWTLSEDITLAANATVRGEATTLKTGGHLLNAESGATLTLNAIKPTVAGGNLFGTFAGNLTVNTLYPEIGKDVTFNSGFTGTLRTNNINYHEQGSKNHTLAIQPAQTANFVFGGGDFKVMEGDLNIEGLSIKSSADWKFNTVKNGHNIVSTIAIGSAGICIDTADFDDSFGEGHTISVSSDNTSYVDNILKGGGSVTATGNGSFVFLKTAQFTGGLIAKNSVTLTVNAGVYPGKGDVTIADTATFNLAQSGSGTVPVAGTLTMAGGTTLRIPTPVSGVLPLSVNAFAFDGVTAQSKVTLNINGGTLADGYYPLIKSATTLPTDAVEAFVLDVNEAEELPAGAAMSLVAQGDTLFLQVGDVSGLPSGVWVGGVDTDMSNRLNWKNWTVPAAGGDLDFSGVSSAATVNADIDAEFRAVTMGTGVVTFTGALTATSFSDTSKVAVGADSTVTLYGDLVFTSGDCYITAKVGDGGAFVVTGTIRATGSADVRPYETASAGWIVAKGLENAETSSDKWNFRLNYSNVAKWVVGEDGIAGTQYFWSFNNDASDTTVKADGDFTIATWLSAGTTKGKGVTFDTSGWTDSSTNYTITADCGFVGVKPLTVKGGGTFLCNYTPESIANYSAYSGAVTVKDTATLAINAGKVPTTGAVTVNAGAALAVAQSGTVALGGDLALKSGAALAFNYTGRDEPVLDLTGKTVTFDEGETTNVTVRISADAGARAHGGKNVLTAGGKFADAKVTLAEGAPSWASGVTVENDEIVLSVKPVGLAVFVR